MGRDMWMEVALKLVAVALVAALWSCISHVHSTRNYQDVLLGLKRSQSRVAGRTRTQEEADQAKV